MAGKDSYYQASQIAGNIGGALSGIGGYMSASGSAASARENAKIARLNAQKSDINYGAQIRETLTNKAINLDSNRVEWAWGGLTMNGTPDLVNKGVASSYDADISVLRQNQKIDRQIYEHTAAAYEAEAKAQEKNAFFSGLSAAISTATTAAAIMMLQGDEYD